MAHSLSREKVDYTRDPIVVRTDYSIDQIAQAPFLFLNQHEKQYNQQVSKELYQTNPDHYWNERLNDTPLTKKDTCNGIPDIRKLFFSARNIRTIAQYTHKRVVCHVLKQHGTTKVEQIQTIYPAIQVDPDKALSGVNTSTTILKTFSPQHLQPYMDQTYRLHGQYTSDNIQAQIDKLNYIVIVQCSDKIINNIKFHLYYLADTNGPVSIWDRPINASNSISHTLPSYI